MIMLKINMVTTQDYYSLIHAKYYDNLNKLITGKMKDETNSDAIKKLVGLKSKVHSSLVDDKSEHQKANGVNKNVVQKNNSQ